MIYDIVCRGVCVDDGCCGAGPQPPLAPRSGPGTAVVGPAGGRTPFVVRVLHVRECVGPVLVEGDRGNGPHPGNGT